MQTVVNKVIPANRTRCPRCGGLMVPEPLYEARTVEWRCVMCGERLDQVILDHRLRRQGSATTKRVSPRRSPAA